MARIDLGNIGSLAGKDLFIHVEVDKDGNVWATYPDDTNHPDLELADGCLWVICDGERVNLGTVRGTKIFTGEGAPKTLDGQIKDDLYIDTADKGLYKLGATWQLLTSLAGGGSSMNLLDNADFRSVVNQRGQSEYTTPGYTIDRWKIWADSKLAVIDGAVKFSPQIASPTNYFYAQYFDQHTIETVKGSTITVSIMVLDTHMPTSKVQVNIRCGEGAPQDRITWGPILGTFDKPGFYSWTVDVPTGSTDGRETKTMRLMLSPTGDITADDYFTVQAVKLELGDHQTLAKQTDDGTWQLLDPPPNPQQELSKCMRYQQVLNAPAMYYGIKATNNAMRVSVPLQVPLRAKPAITNNSDNSLGFRGVDGMIAGTKIASCALNNWSNQLIAVNFTLQSPVETPANDTPIVGYLNSPIILDANI